MIKGDRFGRWVVLDSNPIIKTYKDTKLKYYLCKCDCGTVREVYDKSLISGKSESCGCKSHENFSKTIDKKYIGKKFGRLTVLRRAEIPTDEHKQAVFVCRCDCGNLVEVTSQSLRSGATQSCGCIRSEKAKKSMDKIQKQGNEILEKSYVENTSLLSMQQKISKNNTSGVKGVSKKKNGRYRAYINLKGKQIDLGEYDTLEEAAAARKAGEEKYFKPIIEKYKDKE